MGKWKLFSFFVFFFVEDGRNKRSIEPFQFTIQQFLLCDYNINIDTEIATPSYYLFFVCVCRIVYHHRDGAQIVMPTWDLQYKYWTIKFEEIWTYSCYLPFIHSKLWWITSPPFLFYCTLLSGNLKFIYFTVFAAHSHLKTYVWFGVWSMKVAYVYS